MRFRLIKSPTDMSPRRAFQTGNMVSLTGVYRVVHSSHRLPHEVVILAGERFPRCARCEDSVVFELLQSAPFLNGRAVCRIYELPVIEDDSPEESALA
jgi:hypothetical protein